MPQVFQVADRIHVQRLGQRVLVADRAALGINDVVAAMTGAPVSAPTNSPR
jgi:fructose transport system ATP-binding protein